MRKAPASTPEEKVSFLRKYADQLRTAKGVERAELTEQIAREMKDTGLYSDKTYTRDIASRLGHLIRQMELMDSAPKTPLHERSEEPSALETRKAWRLFCKFTNTQLDTLLGMVGVKPMQDRAMKVHQALIVWFHGSIPNLNEVTRLAALMADPAYKLVHDPNGI